MRDWFQRPFKQFDNFNHAFRQFVTERSQQINTITALEFNEIVKAMQKKAILTFIRMELIEWKI